MATPYKRHINTTLRPTATPQSEPIPGKQMVKNDAGGYVFEITPWKQLERFLVMGTEGGTYYVGEVKLTKEAAKNVMKCIDSDGKRAVDMIVTISDSGRAAKNEPALFALALAAAADSVETRRYALAALPKVARIGTHLFHFIDYEKPLRGWSRSLRNAVGAWYTEKPNDKLELQLAKYQSRDGWSHKDILRLAHPTPTNEAQRLAFKWAVGKYHAQEDKKSNNYNAEQFIADTDRMKKVLPLISAFEDMKSAGTEAEVLRLVKDFNLPLELIPTEKRTHKVYDAVIPNLGITALIRNLATFTKEGIISGMPGDSNTKYIVSKLTDGELLRKGRVHPIQILMALATYNSGRSFRGSSTWQPIRQIVDGLNDAFYESFQFVQPTGKRILKALDVSGSMGGGSVIGAEGLRPCEVTAAMSMVTARTETDYMIVGFSTGIVDLGISPRQRLDDVMRRVLMNNFGGTDCAAAINWAADRKIPIDVFEVYTDNETWAGRRNHPVQALKSYQQKMGIGAKLISLATSSTDTSIVEDTAMTLNICGFDASAPNIISDFIRN